MDAVRYVADTHQYFRGDKELASVTRVIRATWPVKPDFSAADPAVLEHARNRGVLVDLLFTQYLRGDAVIIPAGTPYDIRDEALVGYAAVVEWWNSEKRGTVECQVVVADDEIAGTYDIKYGATIWDLKCAGIQPTWPLQVGAYVDLDRDAENCGIIHCKFSKGGTVATVKPILYDAAECVRDWRTLRAMYELVTRKGGLKS